MTVNLFGNLCPICGSINSIIVYEDAESDYFKCGRCGQTIQKAYFEVGGE